jgi:hypothetical protein
MKIALCNVGSPVYVPAGEYLDGAVLDAAQWARNGEHSLSSEFAHQQEQSGMLEIVNIDGAPVVWGSCCSGH